jgi:outer membrane receptor protein involved in Fe transport
MIVVPAGTVAEATRAIGRQGNLSIAVADQDALARRVAPIRGVMEPEDALRRVARATGLKLRKVAANSYVLSLAAPSAPAARPTRDAASATRRGMTDATKRGQDIIIVASKRDTPSRRFAGQWRKIEGREFGPLGVVGAEAIEARSVGFSSTHLGAGRNKLFIRGIADSSFSGPTQSPVGQYLGDMRTTYSGPDPELKLVDMDAIEILEGPQGTLYGSGSLGGIVLLKPNTPRLNEFGGTVTAGASATWNGDPGYDLSGVINIPLGTAAAFRIVGYKSREGGYIDNRATGESNINDVHVKGGRTGFTAELSPGWFVDLSAVGQEIEGDDSQYADRGGSGLSRDSLVDQPFSSTFKLANLVLRKDGGDVRFRSTTGASWQQVDETFDASANGETRQLGQRSKARALSNETRLWRPMTHGYSWLIGFSSIVHRYRIDRDLQSGAVFYDLAGATNEVREITLYGEAGVELRPRLEVSIGGRYTHSTLTGSGEHLSPLIAAQLASENPRRSEQRLLPSLAISSRPNEALTLYARYQQGFRPGGLSITAETLRLYRHDRLGTAEIGFRFKDAGSDRFEVQGAGTFSRWKDIQADFLDSSGLPVTDNIGDGRVWSASLNGTARVDEKLRFDAGFAWNDGRITNPSGAYRALALAAASAGRAMEIPNIARFVARGAISWRTDLDQHWLFEANGYGRFVGHSRLGIGPRLGDKQGGYFDSGLLLRSSNGTRAISLSFSNLTNEVGNRFAFGAPILTGANQITPMRPRTIRLGFEQGF